MTSSLHCEFDEVNKNFLISSSVAGLTLQSGFANWLCKVGGSEIGLVKGSGSVVGENLILMRSILSLKKSRNAFAEMWYQDCLEVQVDSDGVLNSMPSIEIADWKNFIRNKFERKDALAREISFLTTLH